MAVAHDEDARDLARALGWLSIGLGVAQVAAPSAVTRLVGIRPTDGSRSLVRAVGVRELVAGFGILARRRSPGFLWARVAGDAMDVALLGRALASDGERGRTGAAAAAVAGIAALDVMAAARRTNGRAAAERGGVEARSAITVNASPEDVYARWRDLEGLPTFMYHLESVRATGDRRSHWVARAPAGATVEWEAEITDDVPGRRIAWRSVEGSPIESSGSVRFDAAPGGQGTEVRVEMRYSPPGGRVGAAVAKLFGEEPNQQIRDDLRRFKQIVETGEIARSDASPEGTRVRNLLDQRAARPAEGGA